MSNYFDKHFTSQSYSQSGSVYVHWPYCKRRCSYCNFVKFIPKNNASWYFSDEIIEDAMVFELQNVLKASPIKNVISVFFGGGTPSIGRPQLVEKILKVISQNCSLASNAEVTLEANPTLLEARKLKSFRTAGVNRLSVGVQSFRDDLLKILNRDHSSKEAIFCIEESRKLYPNKVSFDLIFALPHQTVDLWKEDIEYALALCDDHLSLYQLTVENGTLLSKQVKEGLLRLPTKDEEVEMYEFAVECLKKNGFHRYEVSNFARTDNSESVHNKAVWQGGQYIGIGPGAHSRIVKTFPNNISRIENREAKINVPDPKGWLNEVHGKGNGARRIILQTPIDMQMEYIATSLRTKDGAQQARWNLFSSSPLQDIYEAANIEPEFIVFHDGCFKATEKGINVLDSLLPRLINTIEEVYKPSEEVYFQ
ncbi:Radical S-adenosyl methionine domain-containing protein 1, mitochondrial [Armadillidium nasatum]|uniref:Radical S-adenosyl methionine domain-containing protein 1, mitochondrial n=1 Tax=Armadillidium nasatum TaxID=96803 RepID=A0A5N5T0E2_9CRUS|nr:Radical S-adenosyl methionine domain-containing protein 1, mitochondrial [Armadillidium nasatum]